MGHCAQWKVRLMWSMVIAQSKGNWAVLGAPEPGDRTHVGVSKALLAISVRGRHGPGRMCIFQASASTWDRTVHSEGKEMPNPCGQWVGDNHDAMTENAVMDLQ